MKDSLQQTKEKPFSPSRVHELQDFKVILASLWQIDGKFNTYGAYINSAAQLQSPTSVSGLSYTLLFGFKERAAVEASLHLRLDWGKWTQLH